jgi:hypothetical protein
MNDPRNHTKPHELTSQQFEAINEELTCGLKQEATKEEDAQDDDDGNDDDFHKTHNRYLRNY